MSVAVKSGTGAHPLPGPAAGVLNESGGCFQFLPPGGNPAVSYTHLDVYKRQDLDTAQKRLQNLNYFDMVDVAQVGSTRPGYRDINIEVAEKRTGP